MHQPLSPKRTQKPFSLLTLAEEYSSRVLALLCAFTERVDICVHFAFTPFIISPSKYYQRAYREDTCRGWKRFNANM